MKSTGDELTAVRRVLKLAARESDRIEANETALRRSGHAILADRALAEWKASMADLGTVTRLLQSLEKEVS